MQLGNDGALAAFYFRSALSTELIGRNYGTNGCEPN